LDYPFWKKDRSKEELFISSPVINEIEIDSEIQRRSMGGIYKGRNRKRFVWEEEE